MLDETMSGETMALSVINKINNKLNLLYRENTFLTPTLRQLLCNALTQPHFDYLRLLCLVSQLNLKIEKQNPDFSEQMHMFLATVR